MSAGEDRHSSAAPARGTSTRTLIAIGVVLTLLFALLGSVRFARFDWTGVQFSRAPERVEEQISPECTEIIQPYETSSGRTISPVVVDEQQYMALVQYYRGTPLEDLQVVCLYDPFTYRSGTAWLAHWLPFDEAVSISLVNSALVVLALWLMLVVLVVQGRSPTVVALTGALFALGWNGFYFATGLLADPALLAVVTLGWFLLVLRRPWWLVPLLAVAYPIKESAGILVLVAAAWAYQEHREGRRSRQQLVGYVVTCAAVFVASVLIWRRVLPEAGASWNVLPGLGPIGHNLSDPVGVASFVIGVAPLAVPALLRYRRLVSELGWVAATSRPEVVGLLLGLGLTGWTIITADMSPRHFWVAFPFAASLTAAWLSRGRPAAWLERLPLPASLR